MKSASAEDVKFFFKCKFKSGGILYVFPVLGTAQLEEKIRPQPQTICSAFPQFYFIH